MNLADQRRHHRGLGGDAITKREGQFHETGEAHSGQEPDLTTIATSFYSAGEKQKMNERLTKTFPKILSKANHDP